jgi:hypothetical protein
MTDVKKRFDRLLQSMAGVAGQKIAEAPGTSRKARSADYAGTRTRQGKKASASRKRARKSP